MAFVEFENERDMHDVQWLRTEIRCITFYGFVGISRAVCSDLSPHDWNTIAVCVKDPFRAWILYFD